MHNTGVMLIKRLVDIAVSAILLLLLSPVFLLLAIAIVIDSGLPVFFSQIRVGRDFEPFRICKFRSMQKTVKGSAITSGGDLRITRAGRFLRRAKLDELPQLWNVLKGDMSLVGPRPEIPEYVELFRVRYETLLRLRPGITDTASLQFRDEESLLAASADPLTLYRDQILPAKLDLAEKYAANRSLWLDLTILAQTASRVLHLSSPRA